MSKVMWEADRYAKEPKPLTVLSETAHFVTAQVEWFGRKQERRMKKTGAIFATWAEARDNMLAIAERSVASAQSELDRSRETVRKLKALQEPNP